MLCVSSGGAAEHVAASPYFHDLNSDSSQTRTWSSWIHTHDLKLNKKICHFFIHWEITCKCYCICVLCACLHLILVSAVDWSPTWVELTFYF